MKDLTQGTITTNIAAMAIPIMVGMLLQTLYYIVDLYFVSRLGDAAIAGVSGAALSRVGTFVEDRNARVRRIRADVRLFRLDLLDHPPLRRRCTGRIWRGVPRHAIDPAAGDGHCLRCSAAPHD